jgi:hypothetical protein
MQSFKSVQANKQPDNSTTNARPFESVVALLQRGGAFKRWRTGGGGKTHAYVAARRLQPPSTPA